MTAADGDSEGGAPTILLEAQAIGTPIVTTRHADIPTRRARPDPACSSATSTTSTALGDALVTALTAGQRSSAAHVTAHHEAGMAIARLERLYAALADRGALRPVAS